MKKEKELQKLNKEIKNCKKCPLWKTRKNTVPGEGPASAKIMFLGEAAGQEEDSTGRPFCGRAGKLLNKFLEKNGINREKVFISSCLKCHPPKNRPPSAAELRACRNWWQKQIEIIKPKLIVLLGAVAFNTVINQGKFSNFQGKFLTKNDRQYFIVYHPAAGLRFPKIKKIIERDFKKIKII